MNTFRALLLTGLMLSAGLAFGQSVTSSYDKDYKLSRLKVYDYKVEERDKDDPLATDTLMDQKIKDALEDALSANSFHQVTIGDPDFLISYHVSTKDVTEGRRGPVRGPLGPRPRVRIGNYAQGTLILDFIDPETKRLVWRGMASGIVGRDMVDFQMAEDKIKVAARLLLEQFHKDLWGFETR